MNEAKASPEKHRSLLEAKTVFQLRSLAKKLELAGYTKPPKDKLVNLILKVDSKVLARHLSITRFDRYHKHVYGVVGIIALLLTIMAWWGNRDVIDELDTLISIDDSSSDSEKRQIVNDAEKAEENHVERLKQKYELGYALLYIDGDNWYYIPRNMTRSLDWFSTEIHSVSNDAILIQLPTFADRNSNIFLGLGISIPRKVGATVVFFRDADVSIVVECLKITGDATTVVVGVTKSKEIKTEL